MYKEITIEPTTFCGADCIMCARSKYIQKPEHMNLILFKKCIDECAENGYNSFLFGGMGDPLANNDIIKMFEYIKESIPNSLIRLTTTGQLLNQKLFKDICCYVDVVKFSNYGFTKATYESVHRGSLDFEKVKKNILNFISFRNEYINKNVCKNKPYIIMNYLDLKENHHEIEKWIDFWKEKEVDQIDIWKQHNWSGHVGEISNVKERMPCSRVLNNSLAIWVDGCVSICCFDCEKKAIVGTIPQDRLKDILNSTVVNEYSQIHRKYLNLDCTICLLCDQCYNRENALLKRYKRRNKNEL